jgi:hypothetical protein
LSGDWISYAETRNRLNLPKREVETLLRSGALKIRFEGTAKGVAIRYSASDVERIASTNQARKQLLDEAKKLKADQELWGAQRDARLWIERALRDYRRVRIEQEQQEASYLERERQRILDVISAKP